MRTTQTTFSSDVDNLLVALARRGVSLERRGDRIRITPKGAIRGLEADIIKHKTGLLRILDLLDGRLTATELAALVELAEDYGMGTVLSALKRELTRALEQGPEPDNL